MPKRKLIFIALLVLVGTGAWAQRDYRKGYIITNQQDTIHGWIDYRGDVRNAKICSFKKSETDQATDYTPLDIAAYRFTDSKFYVSRNIGSADAPKQVFLEYLVNGMANLYYHRDESSRGLYFIEKDDHFFELKIDEKEVEIDGKTGVAKIKSYVGLLKATLNVWEMSDEIDKAKLDHSSLINITKNYHQYTCTDGSECIVYEKKKPLMALRIGPVVGADLSKLKLMNDNTEKYKFDPSTNFTVGVNLNFWMPRFNEKIFLQMQVMYTKYYYFDAFESPQKTIDTHIRSNVLQMGFTIKYEYPKGKWRPTLAAGGAAIYLPDGTIKEIIDTDKYPYRLEEVRSSTAKNDFPTKFMLGFEIAPGIHYYLTKERIIFIQAQYLQCSRRNHIVSSPNVIRSFGLSAGIYF